MKLDSSLSNIDLVCLKRVPYIYIVRNWFEKWELLSPKWRNTIFVNFKTHLGCIDNLISQRLLQKSIAVTRLHSRTAPLAIFFLKNCFDKKKIRQKKLGTFTAKIHPLWGSSTLPQNPCDITMILELTTKLGQCPVHLSDWDRMFNFFVHFESLLLFERFYIRKWYFGTRGIAIFFQTSFLYFIRNTSDNSEIRIDTVYVVNMVQ